MDKWRQKIHLEPPQGWLNDPNGLCYYKGKYHVYFQYAPSSPYGKGDKCWGHYESSDMLNWIFTGTVLFPDSPDDRSGAYSGCAVVDKGVMHIFYTGNVKEEGNYDYINFGRGANVIHVKSTDGRNMGKKETLLRNSDYPAFCSCHVRDPKVWQENGKWYMVLGARTKYSNGCVLCYESEDLENWKYLKTSAITDFGYMWECPDFFRIGGEQYMSVSPQGLKHGEAQYQNVYQSGYFKVSESLTDFTEWDMGFDFYAPQTFLAPDGRRIMIGWCGIGDIDYENPTAELGWQHCLTLPRVITRGKKGNLLQNPVKEIDKLREDRFSLSDGDERDMPLPLEIQGKPKKDFTVTIAENLKFAFSDGMATLEFTDKALGGGRDIRRTKIDKCTDFRVIADMSSVEIYINGGSAVMTTRFYPEGEEVSVKGEGVDLTLYTLSGMEMIINGK